MTHGLVVGKFYPPHLGHRLLIDSAAARCNTVDVLVVDDPDEDPPAELRAGWLREIHPDVNVIVVPEIFDDENSAAWANHVHGYVSEIDVVFTGEAYGEAFGAALECEHVPIARDVVSISGSQIRENPSRFWAYLDPPVRAHYVKRVVVVGAESTGTTTLARGLAKRFDTVCVPEYGWEYSERKLEVGTFDRWTTSDFLRVAVEQLRREDELARQARHGIMFCDTDALATSVWHERYVGSRNEELHRLAASRSCDLYLLTHHDAPFEEGPLRDGRDVREWMTGRFEEVLSARSEPWFIVKGDIETSLERAVDHIGEVLGILVR